MEFQGVEDSIIFIQLFQVRGRKAGSFVEPQGNMGSTNRGVPRTLLEYLGCAQKSVEIIYHSTKRIKHDEKN